jgi:hypothetical protein
MGLSSRRVSRLKLRVGREKLAAHSGLTPAEVVDLRKGILAIGNDPDADARSRLMAKKTLLEHDWEVYEHENPVVEKSEMLLKGLPQIPSKLEVRIVE